MSIYTRVSEEIYKIRKAILNQYPRVEAHQQLNRIAYLLPPEQYVELCREIPRNALFGSVAGWELATGKLQIMGISVLAHDGVKKHENYYRDLPDRRRPTDSGGSVR